MIVSNTSHISVNRSQLNFAYFIDVGSTYQQEFLITNSGSGILNWTIRTDRNWLTCNPTSGANSAVITVYVYESSEMARGLHTGTIIIESPDADNSPQTVTVNLEITSGNKSKPPFGTIDTPEQGGTASVSQNRSAMFKGEYSMLNADISHIFLDDVQPIHVKKGHNLNIEPKIIYPDSNGNIAIEIKELQRVEIHFNRVPSPRGLSEGTRGLAPLPNAPLSTGSEWSTSVPAGFQLIGQRLATLPIGSFLDSKHGIFYWQPGPGYLGDYELVFIEKIGDEMKRQFIIFRIRPKFE